MDYLTFHYKGTSSPNASILRVVTQFRQNADRMNKCCFSLIRAALFGIMKKIIPFDLAMKRLCCYVNCMAIAVRVALQMLGLYDLRETLGLMHICIVLFLAVIIVLTVHEIAVMGIVNVRRSRRLIEQARENEIYRKLAFTDELTGLANRTAFRENLDKRMAQVQATGAEKILSTVVFTFDLNDLKKCNDTYGHDYGDQYIQMAAEALKKIFTGEGKCYRIGGDEFCAWAPYTSIDEINEKLRILQRGIQECNEKGFVVNVSISAGYAIYEEGGTATVFTAP